MSSSIRRITAPQITGMKAKSEKIVMCTAYDYHSARLADEAGVDTILVGDSMGMTIMGYDSTLPVTMDDILFASRIVARSTKRAFIVADMPFMSYQVSYAKALKNAGKLIKKGGAQAVKLEGATESTLAAIKGCTEAGIPVVAHLGLTPQMINNMGSYKVQGKSKEAASELLNQALAVQEAGAIAVVLEVIPQELAALITKNLDIPTIGIGAGPDCDGEVQVFHDILGFGTFKPRHANKFADAEELLSGALKDYVVAVKEGRFPTAENTSSLDPEVLEEIKDLGK